MAFDEDGEEGNPLEEILRGLSKRMAARNADNNNPTERTHIIKVLGTLDASELDEYRCVKAQSDSVNKQFSRLMQEKEFIKARMNVLWHKLRTRYHAMDTIHLNLHDLPDGSVQLRDCKERETSDD